MNSYAKEISKIKLLSNDETTQLINAMKTGDMVARKKLIHHNMKMVLYIAYKYQPIINLPIDELISIGAVGLIKAIDNFDIEKNIKLSTYAYKCIKNDFY